MENGKFHKTKVSMCVLCKVSKKEKFYNKFFIIVSFTFHYTKIAFFIQKIEFFVCWENFIHGPIRFYIQLLQNLLIKV
jgi:hypothetical protein